MNNRFDLPRFPTLFISHGSPMHAIEGGAAGEAWEALAQRIGKPHAILIASAHWETPVPMLTGSATPDTIHDFGGFPDALYRIQYRAPGAPALAERIKNLLRDVDARTSIEPQRGLDHGAWSPLLHMYPDADIPVLQLSVQPERGARHHFAMGKALEVLREEGVLIIGSGHMTHNLRDAFSQHPAQDIAQYATAFRNWVDERVQAGHADELIDWNTRAPSALRAHPSPEHFLPLFVALGAAGTPWKTETVFSGFLGAALAMDSYRFD